MTTTDLKYIFIKAENFFLFLPIKAPYPLPEVKSEIKDMLALQNSKTFKPEITDVMWEKGYFLFNPYNYYGVDGSRLESYFKKKRLPKKLSKSLEPIALLTDRSYFFQL